MERIGRHATSRVCTNTSCPTRRRVLCSKILLCTLRYNNKGNQVVCTDAQTQSQNTDVVFTSITTRAVFLSCWEFHHFMQWLTSESPKSVNGELIAFNRCIQQLFYETTTTYVLVQELRIARTTDWHQKHDIYNRSRTTFTWTYPQIIIIMQKCQSNE